MLTADLARDLVAALDPVALRGARASSPTNGSARSCAPPSCSSS